MMCTISMLRPGIPQSPFIISHSQSAIFYACGNVVFKFLVDYKDSKICRPKFCLHNDTCHTGTIRFISHFDDGILTCGDDKKLAILDFSLNCRHKRIMSKKLSSAYVVGPYILVADRFGDIYRIKNDLSGDIQFFYSHYTTITTSILVANFSITGNKDGKIVVLDANDPFLVRGICQGHSEFITSLNLFEKDKLLSCSADGKLKVWHIVRYQELQIVDLNKFASEKFGPGTYIPFNIITELGDTSIVVLFAHHNLMMILDISDIKIYKWIQLPFTVQSAIKLSKRSISEGLDVNSEFNELEGYFFVDMNGNLWNNIANMWQKIDAHSNCIGELVDFWKQNERIKGRESYE